MEKIIKMYMLNKQGKKIITNVPNSLYGQYKNMGWKIEDSKTEISKPEEKQEDRTSLIKNKLYIK